MKKGSAQCKSSVIFAGMRTEGKTIIKAKKSRNHTELLCKYLDLPIKIINKKYYDLIEISKVTKVKSLNYKIPADLSSSSFFIVLTALSENSELTIKNVNINPSRIGIVTILKKMGVKIIFKILENIKVKKLQYLCKKSKKLRAINCPSYLNSVLLMNFINFFSSS